MAKQKKPTLTYRIFVNDRPLEDYSPEERAEIGRKATERMGQVFNTYFGEHPDVYVKVCQAMDAKEQAAAVC